MGFTGWLATLYAGMQYIEVYNIEASDHFAMNKKKKSPVTDCIDKWMTIVFTVQLISIEGGGLTKNI